MLPDAATEGVQSVDFMDGSELVALGYEDGTVRLWDLAGRDLVDGPLESGGTAPITQVDFSPTGQLLAAVSDDGSLTVWEPSTGSLQAGPLGGHGYDIYSVAFSPNGALIGTALTNGQVQLWDPSSGEAIASPLGTERLDAVPLLVFTPTGEMLTFVGSGRGGRFELWQAMWDWHEACALTVGYVDLAQLEPYLPDEWQTACPYRRSAS
jgi:WD40 repeat protein